MLSLAIATTALVSPHAMTMQRAKAPVRSADPSMYGMGSSAYSMYSPIKDYGFGSYNQNSLGSIATATTSTPFGGRVDTQSSSPYLNGGGGYGMMGGYGRMGGYGMGMGGYGMGGYGRMGGMGMGGGYGGYGMGGMYGGYGGMYGGAMNRGGYPSLGGVASTTTMTPSGYGGFMSPGYNYGYGGMRSYGGMGGMGGMRGNNMYSMARDGYSRGMW